MEVILIKKITIISLLWVLTAFAADPVVGDVRLEQRTDGSLVVDIYYNVSDEDGDTLEIKLEASNDDGLTWTLPCVSVSGDTGKGVTTGTNKHIMWDFYADNPNVSGSGYRVRITADDHSDDCMDIDGTVYKTVKIGDQLWMAENLKARHYRNGDPIPNVTSNSDWQNLLTSAYCVFDNNESHADTYGYLYNWYAVDDSCKIAPAGWHVPSDEDWKQLEIYLGMSRSEADTGGYRGTNEGSKLAGNASLWEDVDGDLESNSEFGTSGFSALPGGYRSTSGNYYLLGKNAYFWSSTEATSTYAWCRNLYFLYSDVYRWGNNKQCGFSVRCVRD
jgi:uncharacterized protein (TIGR02145 family)